MSEFATLWHAFRTKPKTTELLADLNQCGLSPVSDLTRGAVLLTLVISHPRNTIRVPRISGNASLDTAIALLDSMEPQEVAALLRDYERVPGAIGSLREEATQIAQESENLTNKQTGCPDKHATDRATAALATFLLAGRVNERLHVLLPQTNSPPVA